MNTNHKRILSLINETLQHETPLKHAVVTLEAVAAIINTADIIERMAHEGRIKLVESGMDCDCVKYDGRVHECDATLEAYDKLHDEISEWADGPFSLRIVPWDEEIKYTSRDLAMEAYENGHPHHITFDGE